jgi:hypothetical protein
MGTYERARAAIAAADSLGDVCAAALDVAEAIHAGGLKPTKGEQEVLRGALRAGFDRALEQVFRGEA